MEPQFRSTSRTTSVARFIEIRPQAGPQEAFLATPADIAIYGGSAGSGKTYDLLIEPLRHVVTRGFGAVFFRREMTQITAKGASLDDALDLYRATGASYVGSPKPKFTWPSGASVSFDHLQYESTIYNWQGAQIALLLFDELTHFTEKQFWYMLSRNRSVCGVRPYMRCSTNPDPDSFVRDLVDWWIDDDGFPIQERSGVLRWFVHIDNHLIWGDSKQELLGQGYERPLSLTFIPAKLSDNQILMQADPAYLDKLMALNKVDREQLLDGNWDARPAPGLYFTRDMVEIIDALPDDIVSWARGWDRAGTKLGPGNPDPDWTSGVLMGKRPNGKYVIADVVRFREDVSVVEDRTLSTAKQDGRIVTVGQWQDPGSAGKGETRHYVKLLAGFHVKTIVATKDKLTYFKPFAAQAQHGNVQVLRAPWNRPYFASLEAFPPPRNKGHDDDADATSRAFLHLTKSIVGMGIKVH